MIFYKTGNLMEAEEDFIAHGCNAQGVMGSGVAKTIRETFPKAFELYYNQFINSGLELGSNVTIFDNGKTIINMITQEFYGTEKRQINYGALSKCFDDALRTLADIGIGKNLRLAIPRIGAGLGGGDWTIIEEIISFYSEFHNVDVVVYDLG